MAVTYKDISTLTQKASVAGTEKIPVSGTEYITPAQIAATVDLSGKESTSNKVQSVSSSSTHDQYPTAKCLYDMVGNVESLLAAI